MKQQPAAMSLIQRLLLEPPQPPAGFQTVQFFRPSRKLRTYGLVRWCGAQVIALFGVLAAFATERWFEWSKWLDMAEEGLIRDAGVWPWLPEFITTLLLITGILGYLIRATTTFAEAWLKLRTHWYMIGDEGLFIREGFLQVHELSIRFANIQQVTFKQNIIQRVLNIGDVEVQTAGGSGKANDDGDGINTDKRIGHLAVFRSVDEPEVLRDFLRDKLGKLSIPASTIPDQSLAAEAGTPAILDAAAELHSAAQALRKAFVRPAI